MKYKITATFNKDGQTTDCSTPEVLGGAYNKEYTSKIEVRRAAEVLQATVSEYNLDPSTLYHVYTC